MTAEMNESENNAHAAIGILSAASANLENKVDPMEDAPEWAQHIAAQQAEILEKFTQVETMVAGIVEIAQPAIDKLTKSPLFKML